MFKFYIALNTMCSKSIFYSIFLFTSIKVDDTDLMSLIKYNRIIFASYQSFLKEKRLKILSLLS